VISVISLFKNKYIDHYVYVGLHCADMSVLSRGLSFTTDDKPNILCDNFAIYIGAKMDGNSVVKDDARKRRLKWADNVRYL
jgi:hypothetical protein